MTKRNGPLEERSSGALPNVGRSKGVLRGVALAALTAIACTSERGDEPMVGQKEDAAEVVSPQAQPDAAAAKKAGSTRKSAKPDESSLGDPAKTPDGQRRVWVMMKAKAPVALAAKKSWKARGAEVHKSLRDTASSSQASLLAFLSQRKVQHQAFWAVNTIQVTADEATIQQIAQRSDVARIVDGFRASVPKPDPRDAQSVIQEIEWNIQQVRAPEAWADFGVRGEDVVVGTIDTGAEFSHPALANSYRGRDADGNVDHAYNWHDPSNVCGSPSTTPCDNAGHGTHTMGTIAGDDGAEAQIGVAPGVKWMTAKGCEDFWCSDTALLSSAQWMLAPTDLNGQNADPSKRPHIVSNSWGGGSGDTWYQEMVQAWVAAGIFPVFSIGNSGDMCGSSGSPGDYPESYAVGAYDSFGDIAWFSSRGESAFGEVKPNIAAPGVAVRSSVPGGGYDWYDGTSMAAPHVAGAVALLWSAAPALAGDIATTRALLDGSAVDHEDLSCGGAPENNNVWGQGSLDVYAALEAAPIGPSGTLVGSVTNDVGGGIGGARLSVVGPAVRNSTADPSGAYSLKLPIGSYEVTASAFGYLSASFTGIVISEDTQTDLPITLATAPSHQLDGYVVQEDGTPLFGAEVRVVGTPIPMVLTDETGYFTFGAVPEGTYSVTTKSSGCFQDEAVDVIVAGPVTLETDLDYVVDAYGYQCRPVEAESYAGEIPLGLMGDDVMTTVSLPFQFTFYGETYDSVTVTDNGMIAFAELEWPYDYSESLPTSWQPNGAVYALWDDLMVDDPNQILTATIGSAPDRVFVVEYRDVPFAWSGERTSFQIALHETGEIIVHYDSADVPLALGSNATAGIENATGTVALQHSYRKQALYSGLSVLYEVPFAGFVAGTVTDAVDGAALSGATVSAIGSDGFTRSTTTSSTGSYKLQVPEGDYEVTAEKKYFQPMAATLAVVEDLTTTQDFSLISARAEMTTEAIQLLVPQGESRQRKLTLSNSGLLSLDYVVKEAGGAKAAGVITTARSRNTNVDPNARNTKALFKASAAGAKPNAPGDVLFSFAPGLSFAWGIGEGPESLWIGDTDYVQNHEFSFDGVPTGLSHWASGNFWWQADMAFDSTHGAMCHVGVDGDNGIHCWDESTGAETGVITGDWTWTSQRGLAYKAADDSFFIGGWNEGVVHNVQGLSGANPGEVISSCTMADGSISGLAYNESADALWVATNSFEDFIYQIDPHDCTVLAVVNPPATGGYQGAGLDMDADGNLWAVAQYPNMVHLVDSGLPVFSDVPWLSVTPDAGSVGPGSSTDLNVSINTSGMVPGLYLATLVIQSNAANRPSIKIPVSLVVSGFVKAINTGGPAYMDTTGEAWQRPQAHTLGNWGYVQKGKNVTTNQAISGTNEPVLFQSAHEDPYAYRFDNVPSGIYEVNLHFAELQSNVRVGQRLFDVIIENQVVLPAHDIRYEVGLNAADSWQFFVPVTDGRLDVRFISQGKKAPIVNALRVAHRPDH